MKTEKQIQQLTNKWRKAKSKLQRVQAKEQDLRLQLNAILTKLGNDKMIIQLEETQEKVTFTRNKNYSIPKASIPDIKTRIPETTFNEAFTTSYKLKPAVYNSLSGKCKQAITDHLTIKDSPLSITIKEL